MQQAIANTGNNGVGGSDLYKVKVYWEKAKLRKQVFYLVILSLLVSVAMFVIFYWLIKL
jgi:hypothetical protein